MVAAVQLCQPRARFSFTADCGSQPEAKTSPCLVVLRVDIALLPTSRFTRLIYPQIQLQSLILTYLRTFAVVPTLAIAERWHGVYPKMKDGRSELIAEVAPSVWVVNGLGGAGMTLSFGLAEEVVAGFI